MRFGMLFTALYILSMYFGFQVFAQASQGEKVRVIIPQSICPMTVPESPVIIFDKLQKTVIRCIVSTGRFFVYPGNFSVKVEGNQKLPKYSIMPEGLISNYGNVDSSCAIRVVFEEPFSAGEHKLRFEYKSQKNVIDTGSVIVRVLPSTIDRKSVAVLTKAQKFYFDKRFAVRSKLLAEAEPLTNQCFIEWQFNNQKANQASFVESFVGSVISATSTTVTLSIFWQYPLTGEKVRLFTNQYITKQEGPEFVNLYSATTKERYTADSSEIELQIGNFFMDYEVPIGLGPNHKVDPCSHCPEYKTRASAKDIKFFFVSLDTVNTAVQLVLDSLQQKNNQSIQSITCQIEILETKLDVPSGHILIRVRIRKPIESTLPNGYKLRVRGVLAFQLSASIVNSHNGVEGRSDVPFQVPIQIGN
jgi:hypothetical protein